MSNIIAIEGADGTGKSSFSSLLEKSLPAFNIKAAKTPYGEAADLVDISPKAETIGSFCTFLVGDIAISQQLENYDWIILDRYILSTFVYHWNVIKGFEDKMIKLLEAVNLKKPMITVYLNASEATIGQRLNQRTQSSSHKYDTGELTDSFEYFLNSPIFKPWLGETVILSSENLADQKSGLETLVSKITAFAKQ